MKADIYNIQVTAKISKQMRWFQLQSERQKTQPGLNYSSPTTHHWMQFLSFIMNGTIIQTQKFGFLTTFHRAKSISQIFVQLPCGWKSVLWWHLVTKLVNYTDNCSHRDVYYDYRKPDILIQTSIFPTLAFLRDNLINISLANITYMSIHLFTWRLWIHMYS